jgi:hypothetical protein
MSQINVNKIVDTSGGVLAPISSVMRNRIINGAMVIDQRNAGASVTPTSSGYYSCDRWRTTINQASKFSRQQSTTAPSGFNFSTLITSTSAYSLGATDYFLLEQKIEGFNTADLNLGSANAKTVTLSFWVQSSLTGTFGGALQNSAQDRSYPFTYSIPVANTWTTISVTIAGDTSGTWVGSTNGTGLIVYFGLGVGATYSGTAGAWAGSLYFSATGATSVVGTNGATFYITGVQLEVGTQATSFEYRQYGTELQLCQRYAYPIRGGLCGFANGTTVVDSACNIPVEMRGTPTVLQGTAIYAAFGTGGAFNQSAALNSLPSGFNANGGTLRFSNFTGLTSNSVYVLTGSALTTTYACILSAEL